LTISAFISIQYQSVTDRQTDDRRTKISRSAWVGMLTRDKNAKDGNVKLHAHALV